MKPQSTGFVKIFRNIYFTFCLGVRRARGPHEIVRSPTPCDSLATTGAARRWERGERTALSIGLPAQPRREARTLLRASSRFAPGYGKLAFDSTLMMAVKPLNNKGFRVSRQKLASSPLVHRCSSGRARPLRTFGTAFGVESFAVKERAAEDIAPMVAVTMPSGSGIRTSGTASAS
jgi:hypothetical protein